MASRTPPPPAHVPPGVTPGAWLVRPDGQRLRVHDWPLASARGAVLLVHGLGEHGARYARLAAWFRQRGYAVRAYDQRGHGLTPGPRGALRHADDLLADLAAVYAEFAATLPGPPVLLGHSMGGLVALRAVLDRRVAPPALVLSSPALRSRESAWRVGLARALARIAPNLPLRNRPPSPKASHDPAVVAAYLADPLRSGRITPRLADFIFRAGAACIADAPRLAVRTLLLVAGSDDIVDPSGSSEFSRRAAPTGCLTTRYFSMLYHELLNEAEPWRTQVLLQLGDWLAAREDAADAGR